MIARKPGRGLALALLVFVAGVAVFSLGASRRAVWRFDEFRYLEVVREMALPDASAVVPTLSGKWYDHKPPGYFWGALALHHGLGLGIEGAGKGVSVVSAAATVALVYALGASLGGASMGLAAAAVLASAQLFASLAMRANIDALLAALVTAALWAFARAEGIAGAPGRHAARWRLLAGACCGLAMLVKGPVALGIPAVVAIAYAWLRRGTVAPRAWLPAVAAAALPSLVWLGFASLEAGPDYVRDLVLGHGVAHPFGLVGKLKPVWYYLEQLPMGVAPWSLLLPAALLLVWQRRAKDDGDAFVLAWVLAPLVLLTLFPAKRHLYLLPLYPGVALAIGRWLVWSREPDPQASPALRIASVVGRRATGALLVVASVAAVALHRAPGWVANWHLEEVEGLATVSMRGAALLSLALAAGVGGWLLASGSPRAAWRGSFGLAAATLLFLLGVVHPLQSAGTDSSPFYERVATRVQHDRVAVLQGTDYSPELRLPDARIRRVVASRDALAAVGRASGGARATWLIAEEPRFEALTSGGAFEPVLRHESPLGKTLLLLRVRGEPPGSPRAETEAGPPGATRGPAARR